MYTKSTVIPRCHVTPRSLSDFPSHVWNISFHVGCLSQNPQQAYASHLAVTVPWYLQSGMAPPARDLLKKSGQLSCRSSPILGFVCLLVTWLVPLVPKLSVSWKLVLKAYWKWVETCWQECLTIDFKSHLTPLSADPSLGKCDSLTPSTFSLMLFFIFW